MLNHVGLTVADRERSAAFYGEHFGLTERIHEDEDRLILASDDGSELALVNGEPVAARLPHANHFGFRLADDAAVRAARERMQAAGVTEFEWQDEGRFVASWSSIPTATSSSSTPTEAARLTLPLSSGSGPTNSMPNISHACLICAPSTDSSGGKPPAREASVMAR